MFKAIVGVAAAVIVLVAAFELGEAIGSGAVLAQIYEAPDGV